MLVGDIYEIKDTQILAGDVANPILNVYHYRCVVGDPLATANNVESIFQGTVGVVVVDLQTTSLQHTNHQVTNLSNPTDFISVGFTPPAGQGTAAGHYLPATNCWSFIFNRSTTVVRNGWKRIAGITEGMQANGAPEGPAVALLNTAATRMGQNLTVGGATLEPIILRKQPVTGGGTVYFPFSINGVQFSKIGTQNTRKR